MFTCSPKDLPQHPRLLRIRTLGGFVIHRHDRPLEARRARTRPLELLKCILAAGAGGALRERLADALWPDADGDMQKALEINVHRLREMLGHRHAVLATNGRICLNSSLCWVDAIAFEEAVLRAEQCATLDAGHAMQALILYAGHFLEQEADHPWILRQRERLRSRFVLLAEQLARQLDASVDAESVIEIYRIAIMRDPLNEIFHCGLIAALDRAGRRVEAIAACRRYEQATRAMGVTAVSNRVQRLWAQLALSQRSDP